MGTSGSKAAPHDNGPTFGSLSQSPLHAQEATEDNRKLYEPYDQSVQAFDPRILFLNLDDSSPSAGKFVDQSGNGSLAASASGQAKDLSVGLKPPASVAQHRPQNTAAGATSKPTTLNLQLTGHSGSTLAPTAIAAPSSAISPKIAAQPTPRKPPTYISLPTPGTGNTAVIPSQPAPFQQQYQASQFSYNNYRPANSPRHISTEDRLTTDTNRRKFSSPVMQILAPANAEAILKNSRNGDRFAAIGNKQLLIAALVQLSQKEHSGESKPTVQELSAILKVQEDCLIECCSAFPLLIRRRANKVQSLVHKRLLVCYNYGNQVWCGGEDCSRLHVCCRWLFGKCENLQDCSLSHEILGAQNEEIVAPFISCLNQFENEQLRLLFLGMERNSTPPCKWYNSPNGCKNGAKCRFFHVCSDFVRRACDRPCGRNHRIRECDNIKILTRKHRTFHPSENIDQLRSRLSMGLDRIPGEASPARLMAQKSKRSRKKKKTSKPSPASLDSSDKRVAWKFLDNDGQWVLQGSNIGGVSFGLHASIVLETALHAGILSALRVQIGDHVYSYDKDRMIQTNRCTKVTRSLLRQFVSIRRDVPSHWMPMVEMEDGGERAVLHPLEKGGEEYLRIQDHFEGTSRSIPGAEILEIYRVQNPFLKKMYDEKKAELQRIYKQYPEVQLDEELLFHGTRFEAVRGICEENFDWRRSGESVGTLYGQGAYFAIEPSMSHAYTRMNDRDQTRFIFVASVLTGPTCEGYSSMRYPGVWKDNIRYDTAVNDFSDPRIYVKFDSHEYYPAYLIQYTVDPASSRWS